MQRDHEFHIEGPDLFPPSDTLNELPPPGVYSPMVCPVESEPPLVGGDPATWSPYALDGSPPGEVSQTPPQSPEDPSSASQFHLVAARLPELVEAVLDVASISDFARGLEGSDVDRAPDDVFVSNLDVPLMPLLPLSPIVDSLAADGDGDSFWSKDSRPYQSMIDAVVHTPPPLSQLVEQIHAVIAA